MPNTPIWTLCKQIPCIHNRNVVIVFYILDIVDKTINPISIII